MQHTVYFAHAPGEEKEIEKLAAPIQDAGYVVQHRGTVLVGESVLDEASKILSTGCAVVLCGTIKAIGTGWARRIVNAARVYSGVRIFAVQLDREADMQTLALDSRVADYWRDPGLATTELLAALKEHYPLSDGNEQTPLTLDAERRYRELALQSCDIIDLANLPEDRHAATRQLELRRLYVPLRIRVEAVPQTEGTDEQLEAIERRREARRRGSSPWTQEDTVGRAPIGERLAKARRLIVLGDPGAGKSTIVRWLATAYLLRLKNDPDWQALPDVVTLPAEDWLPIMIRCRDLDPSCVALEDILRHILRMAEITDAESRALQSILATRIQKGTALLLIDGLDEISDPISRANFCRQIERISLANPNLAIVVTSRIVGYREMGYRIGRGFEHVSVDDFSPEDKDDFARRWCTLTQVPGQAEAAAIDLIKDIHSTSRIERLTGNPMLLTTMALVKRKVGKLPRRRIDLYWEAVQVLLNWRSEVDQPIDHREALPQLEYVAYAMCQQGAQQLRDDEIIGLFERMREEYPRIHAVKAHTPEEFLTLLERRTGILVQAGQVRHQGRSVPVYEFRHLTFQEYLAALALVDGRFPERDSSRTLGQTIAPLASRTETARDANGTATMVVSEAWREALRLCVACCKDDEVDDVMRAILDPLPGEEGTPAVRSRAILAALCLADEPNISEPLAAELLRRLLEQFQADLGSNDDDVTNALKELSTSRWAGTTSAACLLHYRHYVAKDDLRAWKLFAGYGLALEPRLPNDGPSLKTLIEECLANLTSDEPDKIIDAASKIFVLLVARDAATISPYITELDVPATLFALLRREPMIALAGFLALAGCSQSSPTLWTPSEAQLAELFQLLDTYMRDRMLLILAAFLLGAQHYSPAVPVMLRLLDHPHKTVREAVAESLGDMEDPRAAEGLIARLRDEEASVRQAALLALGKLKTETPVQLTDPAKAEPLVAFFRDADAETRRAAARALGRIRYTGAVDPLAERLQDENESSSDRAAAAEALGLIGDARAIPPLLVVLRSQDWSLSSSAATALGKIGVPAIAPLIANLNDDYMLVTRIADALAIIGDPAIAALLKVVDDDNGPRAEGAMTALARMKSQRAIPHLIAKLDAPDPNVIRWQAAYALADIGGPDAIAALRARVLHGDATLIYYLIWASLPTMNDIDRVFLSAELEGRSPLTPSEPITEARVQQTAAKLGLSPDAVRTRYNELAPEYFLLLEWGNSATAATQDG